PSTPKILRNRRLPRRWSVAPTEDEEICIRYLPTARRLPAKRLSGRRRALACARRGWLGRTVNGWPRVCPPSWEDSCVILWNELGPANDGRPWSFGQSAELETN